MRVGSSAWIMQFAAAAALVVGLSVGGAPRVEAAELVMIDADYCEWCEIWQEEVGVVYHKTPEARQAPLRRVEMSSSELKALSLSPPARYTPTFILIDGGKEIGRIEGYPGEHHFWGLLNQMLRKLPEGAS